MRFLRHLAAASLTVAVVIALGLCWAHASGNGPAGQLRLAGPSRPGGGSGLGDVRSLVRAGLAETVVCTIVVTVSAARLRRRRARRRRSLAR